MNDCKDPNSVDCIGQPRLAAPAVTCGTCSYMSGCTQTTAGSCINYAPFVMKSQYVLLHFCIITSTKKNWHGRIVEMPDFVSSDGKNIVFSF